MARLMPVPSQSSETRFEQLVQKFLEQERRAMDLERARWLQADAEFYEAVQLCQWQAATRPRRTDGVIPPIRLTKIEPS